MELPLVIALWSAAVTIFGWLVNHVLTGHRERQKAHIEDLLRYTERQLEELYGPLAFLILDGQQTFNDLLASLGRRTVFLPDGSLPDNDLKTWLFWLDNYFFPKNERIKDLIATKTHLIEGDELPASYLAFLEHHNAWYLNHLRWKKKGVEYSWHSKMNAPQDFGVEVLETFKRLKRRHAQGLRRLSTRNAARRDPKAG